MKVFLVPVGPAEHIPYSEPSETVASDTAGEQEGFLAGLTRRFREVISVAEQTRRSQDDGAETGWAGRAKRWGLRWLADRIAEQRLLWQLRNCEQATLIYPSDLDDSKALRLVHDELKRDGERHRRWLVVDVILLVASAVLTIVP